MLKMANGTKNLFNAMAEKTKEAFSGDLKTRKHSLKLGFNDPGENDGTGTHAELAFHLCGSHYNEFKVRMNQYEGTYDDKHDEYVNQQNKLHKVEIVIGKLEDADGWCDKVEIAIEEGVYAIFGKDRYKCMPKVHYKNGNVIVGFQYPIKIRDMIPVRDIRDIVEHLKVPYDIQ